MQDFELNNVIKNRKDNFLRFLKNRSNLIIYSFLALVIYLAVWIRTRNISGLRDVTTGGWTLGPDLDPFLFLRYAKYIIENGTLFSIDMMRYVPLGIETGDFSLHYYSIAWFHKLAVIFGSTSVDQSAALFPVFMFALTVVAFFLLSKEVLSTFFNKNYSNIGAIISSLFFSLIPLFIPRTIAGIPEKESSAFLFMFLAFYFFIKSWDAEGKRNKIILGALAGISTGLMALIWGAYSYIFFILIPAVFVSFLIGNFEKKHIPAYAAWIISAIIVMVPFSTRYKLNTIPTSFDRGVALALLATVAFYHYLYPRLEKKISHKIYVSKLPPRLASTIIFGVALVLVSVLILGPGFLFARFGEIYSNFVRPAASRLIQTVAENRQPYLVEWVGNFGPNMGGIFITFWALVIGSIIIFWKSMTKFSRKERFMLTSFFAIMVFAVLFSRYSSSSIFNGESFISLFVYGCGMLAFIIAFLVIYFRVDKNRELHKFESVSIGLLVFLSFFFISLISARGFIRLVMIVVPPLSIILGYMGAAAILSIKKNFKDKEKYLEMGLSILVLLLIVFSAYGYFTSSKSLAASYIPSPYTQQWQKSMGWVRENTSPNAVFGHWWDYGYWVQSMGERATALDGGNAISYWNHLMGRYALTESNFDNTLDFLYAHNITHFLIDSTDIGKYSAYSTIGSDSSYDRRSWIPTFLKDNSQTTQRKNTTLLVYSGGTSIDQDIIYELDGEELFLPEGKAYIAALIVSTKNDGVIEGVLGAYYYQEKLYQIPIRYYWTKETGLVDTGVGIKAGAMIYPRVTQNSAGGGDIDPLGASLYLSPRTINTNLVNYYLFGKTNNNFVEVHSEPDMIVQILESQGIGVGDFVFFNEFRGPIKIWEVNYPSNMIVNQSYLETDYPDSIRLA